MALNTTGLNTLLDSGKAGIAFLSLHSGAVGSGSGNELTGGSPAYARKAATWAAASGGASALSGSYVFDVPAGSTVSRVGFWTALSGGTFLGDVDVTDETFTGQGTLTLTAASSTITLT
jgi:hypothetical protein